MKKRSAIVARLVKEHRIAACEHRATILRAALLSQREAFLTAARIHEGLARAHIQEERA